LVPATTSLAMTKRVRRRTATFANTVDGPWSCLACRTVEGYEIHYGSTEFMPPAVPVLPDGLGFTCGSILAVYLHGLAEDPGIAEALTGAMPARTLDDAFIGLADLIDEAIDVETLFDL
jgi:adenosylcobyric acid synthase